MLSHLDKQGRPRMVDVGAKPATRRTAHAIARVELPAALADELDQGEIVNSKGAVFQTAQLAGVLATKRTGELIPLCHPLRLDDAEVAIERTGPAEVTVHCRVRATERTGVEMEALTGAAVAALTLYDMTKGVSHGIVVRELRLLEKTGGKKDWRAPDSSMPAHSACKVGPRVRTASGADGASCQHSSLRRTRGHGPIPPAAGNQSECPSGVLDRCGASGAAPAAGKRAAGARRK